jgi:hypothetical protein
MLKRKALIVIVVVALVAVSGLAAVTWYAGHAVAYRDNDAVMLWSADEAYVFIKVSRLGWQRGPLALLRDFTRAALGVGISGATPTDVVRDLVVVRITRSGVERFDIPDLTLGFIGVADGRIYGVGDGRTLRWTQARFEPLPPHESFEPGKMARMNFENRDGWSGRSNILSQPSGVTPFTITVGGDRWTVTAHNDSQASQSKSIEIGRDGENAKEIWSQVQRTRFVGFAEYDAFLSDRAVIR